MNKYINTAQTGLCGDGILGPGKRFVIWTQGCCFNCPGCINQKFREMREKDILRTSEIYEKVYSHKNSIEGVTVTGGEPFLQPEGLSELCKILHENGFGIITYTGFCLSELIAKKNKAVYALLDSIDVLIDGRYDLNQKSYSRLKGSENQNIYFFTDRYKKEDFSHKNLFEAVSQGDIIKFTGFYNECKIKF